MAEKSLEQLLSDLHTEKLACEQTIDALRSLSTEVSNAIFQQVDNRYNSARSELVEELEKVALKGTAAALEVTKRLEESTFLLETQTALLKKVHRRNAILIRLCFGLSFFCCFFIGWSGYLYWNSQSLTKSDWFAKIFIANIDTIDRCLQPDRLKQLQGKCTISLLD